MLLGGLASSVAADEFPEYLDLSSERLETIEGLELAADSGPLQRLDAALASGPPYRFEAGPLVVYTDPRWFTSLPPTGMGSPLIELRRWPGDSALTLYPVAGPISNPERGCRALPGATLTYQSGDTDGSVWKGTLTTEMGERPIWWIERRIEDSTGVLGAALLPGDAGLGAAGIAGRAQEMLHLLTKVEVRRAWSNYPPYPRETELLLPTVGDPPGDKSELTEPWQVVRGTGFTVGLPPGFRALRIEGKVRAPDPIEGQALWFRGVVSDSLGETLRVGDGWRVGYVSRLDGAGSSVSDWLRSPPLALADRASALKRAQAFELLATRSQATTGHAARFEEAGWSGQWFIFRMVFEDHRFEIGMPVIEGSRSPSLYWIPLTWRDIGRAPAPPPVDPAERFGIRFDRFRPLERNHQPWSDGTLDAPGITMEIPRGWFPAASLRSADGYPVRLIDQEGNSLGRLVRVDPAEVAALRADELRGWTPVSSRGSGQRATAHRGADGALLVVSKAGHGFLLEADGERAELRPMWERLVGSVRLRRERRPVEE
ncbi:MAG: hypothetical protein OES25_07760 [Acidobacteriota bacterium]|nr:hypothetical protein [Acidobacteriota bacterium]